MISIELSVVLISLGLNMLSRILSHLIRKKLALVVHGLRYSGAGRTIASPGLSMFCQVLRGYAKF